MPFITQGKANIKYLLIVILVAAVACGIIYVAWNSYQKEIVSLGKFIEIKLKKSPTCSSAEWLCPLTNKCIKRGEVCSNGMPGGAIDEHDCNPTAGYTWCEIKQKCLRSWEESCSVTSTDEAANWKTYMNSDYGFELKYPEILNSYPVSVTFYDYVPVGGTNPSIGGKLAVADGNIETQTDKPDSNNWPWLWGKADINFLIFSGIVTDLENVIGVSAQKVNLNNATGYKTTDSYGNVTIFVQSSKNIFQISYTTAFGNDDQISKNRTVTIEKIISTFKFSK